MKIIGPGAFDHMIRASPVELATGRFEALPFLERPQPCYTSAVEDRVDARILVLPLGSRSDAPRAWIVARITNSWACRDGALCFGWSDQIFCGPGGKTCHRQA